MPEHAEATPGRWLLDTIMEQWGRLTTHGIYTEAAQRGLDAAWSAGTLPGHPDHRPPPGRPCEQDVDPWTRIGATTWIAPVGTPLPAGPRPPDALDLAMTDLDPIGIVRRG